MLKKLFQWSWRKEASQEVRACFYSSFMGLRFPFWLLGADRFGTHLELIKPFLCPYTSEYLQLYLQLLSLNEYQGTATAYSDCANKACWNHQHGISTVKTEQCELEEAKCLQVADLQKGNAALRSGVGQGLIRHRTRLRSCPRTLQPPKLHAALLQHSQDPIHCLQAQPPSAGLAGWKYPCDEPRAGGGEQQHPAGRGAMLQPSSEAETCQHTRACFVSAPRGLDVCVTLDEEAETRMALGACQQR